MSQLQGKIALVTGGTTGIGLATAKQFHADGAKVIITGQNPATLEAARHELPDDVLILRADVRSIADTERVAAEIQKRFGGLDVAFLNAGIAHFVPLESVEESFFDDTFDINVKGVFFAVQKLAPILRPGASVLVTTSVVASRGSATSAVYSASKGAVAAMVRALAAELAPRGIRVNAISPGPIDTPIFSKLTLPKAVVDDFTHGMAQKVPLGRFGRSEEVAKVVSFIASPNASFITGSEIPVDGGVGTIL